MRAKGHRAFQEETAPVAQYILQPGMSEKLREAGIPGVKYLDGNSRHGGAGTRNYVVFDDRLIEIVAKDGQPVASLAHEMAGVARMGDVADVVEACK